MIKINIIIFLDWFIPAFKAGGPIKSISNLINALCNEINFYVITGDRDVGENTAFKNIVLNKWYVKPNYRVIYLSPDKQNLNNYKNLIKKINPHAVYINGLFSLNFSIKPLIATKQINVKTIIAPRGMLGQGALSIKPLKKLLFIKAAKLFGLYESVIWHATDLTEQNEILSNIYIKAKIKVIPNIPVLSSSTTNFNKHKEPENLKLIYLSRISIKKNLLFLLEILYEEKNLKNITLDIYGPIEDEAYFEKCQSLMLQINSKTENKVKYKQSLQWNEIQDYLPKYHFFVLPTLHENFGHAIFESLSLGVPVIISQKTPWKNLFQQNIGWDIPLIKKQWSEVLNIALKMNETTYKNFSESCINFAYNWIKKQNFKEQYLDLFNTNHEV